MSDIKSGQLTLQERIALIPSVAMKRFEGLSEAKIAEALKISRRQVGNILRTKEYDDFLQDIQDQALKHALANFRQELDKLAPLAVLALKQGLKDGKVEAVKLWSQLVGGLKQDDKAENTQAIQIVLPNGLLKDDKL